MIETMRVTEFAAGSNDVLCNCIDSDSYRIKLASERAMQNRIGGGKKR